MGERSDDGRRSAAERAMRFVVDSLAARAQSVAEIEAKLAVRAVPADVAADVVAEASRLGYLNDAELAAQLSRGYRARGYGSRRAEREPSRGSGAGRIARPSRLAR